MYARVCLYVCERERDLKRDHVQQVSVCEREGGRVCERVCICVCVREGGRESV